jgi:hypothetical protein
MKDPVRGTAQVVSCTSHHGRGVYQSCRMQLVVQAEGVPATAVEHSELVHNKRWPMPGMVLPIAIDRADPQQVKVEWDEVETSSDRARRSAESLAAAQRGEEGAESVEGATGNVSGGDLSKLDEAQKAQLRRLGIDLDALAAQQGDRAPSSEAAADEADIDDQLARLERLGKLHDEGILSDAELAEQKKRILGD